MFTPFRTERLLVRHADMDDLEPLLARRNEPEVARYQDWTLPYPRERAERMLSELVEMDGPVNDEWWMATIVTLDDDEVIGDLAVHLSTGGRSAEIGYSLASAYWSMGYAGEAVDALIDYLFEDLGVSRVSATLHPDNIASAMVVERAGLLYEGHTRLSFWLGDGDDAVGSDDLLYGFTRSDWESWQDRKLTPPKKVRLVEITSETRREVEALETHKSQERFVSPMALSFSDALYPPDADGGPHTPLLRAVEADGELVGFVMLALASDVNPEPYLWRLLIDRKHQRRGIGGRGRRTCGGSVRGRRLRLHAGLLGRRTRNAEAVLFGKRLYPNRGDNRRRNRST